MQNVVEAEGRREAGSNQFQTAVQTANGTGLINGTEQTGPNTRRSILGDVRRITTKKSADGRDVVEIEHTDGTETIFAFETIS